MNIPTPVLEKYTKEKSFTIEFNSKKYNLILKLNNSSIIIFLEDKNTIPQINYEKNFSYDIICKLSRIFRIYDNIEEIYDNIISFIEAKKYSCEIKNNLFILNFNLDLGSFSFELSTKKGDINETLDFLGDKIKFLIEENKEIKSKMNLILEENKELKNKIESLEKKINIKNLEDNCVLFQNSTIIQSIEEKKLISNWILPNTKIITQLIYKAKRDGDKASDFHSKCDNMGPLLIIIQTTTGYRFGGYTSKSWTKPSEACYWPGDSLAFIFSLNLKRKFEIKIPEQAIGHYKEKGPVFGYGHGFDISSGCLHNTSSYHKESSSYKGLSNGILTNENNFMVSDYEVFQIKFQ